MEFFDLVACFNLSHHDARLRTAHTVTRLNPHTLASRVAKGLVASIKGKGQGARFDDVG
jgi:hypothetical protein